MISGSAGADFGAAGESGNPGEEFARAERLGDVIVRADFQAAHFVFLGALGGQHEDGQVRPGFAKPVTDFDAVEFREHHVEHDEIEFGIQAALRGGEAVGHHVDGMARAFEQVRQPVPQQRIIFDDEDFHGIPNLSVIRRRWGKVKPV
jgi:hypothetical protein